MTPLAIVGCALRTPGAANAQEFWTLLQQQQRTLGPVPDWRWNVEQLMHYRQDIARAASLRWGSFLQNIDHFDADFFGIAPDVASTMDPQQRQVLEVGYLCAEQAGLSLQALHGSRTGVYIGISSYDYNRLMGRDYRLINAHAAVGTSQFAAANRLSWFFKSKGPSMSVDAACASSFVALYQASQALHCGDIDLAFVGGVNAILTPDVAISFAQAGLLSQDGHCRVFDAKADGYVRAEACGMVAVKRLDDAVHQGDRILGVVRSVKLTQTGLRQGFMTPNGIAQEALMQEAWQAAGIQGHELDYLEAHATGTALGDAIELMAMHKQLRAAQRSQACPVGSYKPNIGYPEAASGIVGLIKVLKMFEHNQIPGQADYHTINPALENCTLLDIAAHNRAWPVKNTPRLAGLNALGAGGTYAHVVLEEPPKADKADKAMMAPAPLWALPLSAPNPEALQRVLAATADAFAAVSEPQLQQACWLAAHRKTHFKCRHLVCGQTAQELRQALLALTNKASIHVQNKPVKRVPKVVLHWQSANPNTSPQWQARVLEALEQFGIVPTHVLQGPVLSSIPNAVDAALMLILNFNPEECHDEPSLQRFVLQALAQFYEAGGEPQWPGQGAHIMSAHQVLPPYPFAAQRHWVDDIADQAIPRAAQAGGG